MPCKANFLEMVDSILKGREVFMDVTQIGAGETITHVAGNLYKRQNEDKGRGEYKSILNPNKRTFDLRIN